MKLLALVVAVAVTADVRAAAFRVKVVTPPAARATTGTLTLRPVVEGPAIRKSVDTGQVVDVEGADGTYVAELHLPGVWLAPRTITIHEGSLIELSPHPVGTIAGTIDSPGSPVRLRFTDSADPNFSGDADCTTDGKTFRCDVPAGTFDLRLARDGHVPMHRWKILVVANETVDAGALAFVAGASITGRVATESGTLGNDARISLVPAARGIPSTSITPDRTGFFSAGPIAPADYIVTATQKDFVSTPVAITIRQGFESLLRDPVVLAKPRRLSVLISPPVDPIAVGWMVALRQNGPKGTEPRLVAEGAASPDGSWSAENLVPGHYELIVRPKGGPVWLSEPVEIADALTTRHVSVPSIRFEGRVTLGDKPLAAQLIFGGSHSGKEIPWRSNEDGEFHGYMPIPENKSWVVSVISDFPPVDVTLEDVPMDIDESDGTARVEVTLPGTAIHGYVVDEHDQPVPYALINVDPVQSGGRMTQIKSDDTGFFSVVALRSGRYRVTASDYMKESEAVEIDIPRESEDPLSLRVQPYRQWKGRLVTPAGQPVPGARIIAAAADVPILVAYPARTDTDGRFVVLVPAAARLFDFIVAPRGFTYNYFRRVFSDDLTIVVNPNGGTLLIDVSDTRAVEPAVWHNGSVTSAYAFVSGWLGEIDRSAAGGVTRLRIPQLDPGTYTLCLVPAGTLAKTSSPGPDCSSVYLPPYGESRLAARTAPAGP